MRCTDSSTMWEFQMKSNYILSTDELLVLLSEQIKWTCYFQAQNTDTNPVRAQAMNQMIAQYQLCHQGQIKSSAASIVKIKHGSFKTNTGSITESAGCALAHSFKESVWQLFFDGTLLWELNKKNLPFCFSWAYLMRYTQSHRAESASNPQRFCS